MSSVIHIGQPKAASSSLQRALWNRREQLAAAGIFYPVTPTRNHNCIVADFLLTLGVQTGERFHQGLRQIALEGSWDHLVRQAHELPHLIVSSEFLSTLPPTWIEPFIGELRIQDPTILLCVRRASDSLPSSYSQQAKTMATIRFEPWVRAQLGIGNRQGVFPLDVACICKNWSRVGMVKILPFQPDLINEFEAELIRILAINVSQPFLGHHNASPSAAMVEAWQRLLRARRVSDPGVLKRVPDLGSGRFALQPDVARALDAAYPTRGTADPAARLELDAMVLRPEPLTSTGLSEQEWTEAVSACSAALEAHLR
ncbi:hypothetical protein [Synechococcus sp. CBW1004]|uniref:hypothetical protein n=1 Tax=Synechococcus sp. CBW1004 TaxID=1353136 RepID=UPI0018CEC4E9|nr:hypothetical protein [Synechococcus sp. CBW1004]QPN62405.1 hypothetical protein H8F25_11850 [Synechococcus sp. CBW1004]